MTDTDWPKFVSELCTLLDAIECHDDATDDIVELCQERFALAELHGLTVERGGETSGTMQ